MALCSIIRHLLLSAIALSLLHCTHTGDKEYLPANLSYFFSELHVKGYEGMMELIDPWLEKARKIREEEFSIGSSSEMAPTIRQAYIIALSRAHHDSVVDKLVKNIRSRTSTKTDFFPMISVIARQSSAGLKNPDRSPLERATYFYILENIITSVSTYVVSDKRAVEILQIIANADIEVPDSVHNERYIHALEPRSLSPSKVAENILKKTISK
ncbi:MAG: hypothetical protein OXK80_06515 [Bdellovibrionales bacterium]|nr:hypothetical protein [Bdellovibrionales bacterium]